MTKGKAVTAAALAVLLVSTAGCGLGIHLSGPSPFSSKAPVLISFVSPNSGARGTPLILRGAGFAPTMTVTVGGTPCINLSVTSAAQATCLAGGHAGGSVDVEATKGTLKGRLSQGFLYINYLYVGNSTANDVWVYALDPKTGAPTKVGASDGPTNGARSIAIEPYGRYLYVANQFTNDISIFTTNPSTGAINFISSLSLGSSPRSILISPDGKFVFVLQPQISTLSTFSIDLRTGNLIPVANLGIVSGTDSIALHPSGSFLYLTGTSNNAVFSYAVTNTGSLTAVGSPLPTGLGPRGLALHPNGKFLYVANNAAAYLSVFQVDPGSGNLTALANSPASPVASLLNLAIDSQGQYLYATNAAAGAGVAVFPVDGGTGSPGTPVTFAAGNGPSAVISDLSGAFLYVASALSNDLWSFGISSSPTPTPGTTVATDTAPIAILVN